MTKKEIRSYIIKEARMPRGFSEEQKKIINERLKKEGLKLFEKYGLQKTTVEEIAKNSGISKGAFYLFYPSKESLFFEIIEKIERDFKKKLFQEIEKSEEKPEEILRKLIMNSFNFIFSNPIIKNLSGKDLTYLYNTIPSQTIEKHMSVDISQFLNFISQQMDKGYFPKKDTQKLKSFFKIFEMIIFSKDRLDDLEFNSIIEILTESLVSYLKRPD